MSGLLALLDDVAAIAKLAAAQLDDVAAQTAKTSAKVAGVIIDDTAVAPKYVEGLPAARELPIVLKIARGSIINKLVFLMPLALLLDAFAPWALTPLLMVGGAYLCFEGAEKIAHLFSAQHAVAEATRPMDAARLEEQRVKGAIKTDFILSAEITTIAMASIDLGSVVGTALVLAAVGIGITALVYGAVAVLVKADDVGLRLSRSDSGEAVRTLGRGIVKAMPTVMKIISAVGTAAMLWVGGNIIVHGLHTLGVLAPYDLVRAIADGAAASVGVATGAVRWFVTAALDGVFGLALGLCLVPVVTRFVVPTLSLLFPEKSTKPP